MPFFKINNLDITRYIESIAWSDNDLDGPNSGRTLDTVMQRNKLGSKHRADIKLVPIDSQTAVPIMQVLKNQYFECKTDLIPDMVGQQTLTVYNSTRKGAVSIINTDGKVIHKDISFNIIER